MNRDKVLIDFFQEPDRLFTHEKELSLRLCFRTLSTTVVTKEQKRGDACSGRDEQELDGSVGKRTRRGGNEWREKEIPPSNKKVAEVRGCSASPSWASQSP